MRSETDENNVPAFFSGSHVRYVDPNGQENPETYVKKLNEYAGYT